MARPRKQTYTMEMYLRKIKDGDIDNNADVQRKFVWSNEQINELIVTILTDEYIPPIILGEEDNSQLHIADGGQRSSALNKFRYGNYKITTSIEDSIIPYKKKIKDKNGNIKWEDTTFDIKNKTYEKLPDELRKKFNEYQIETVIHENCDSHKISKYIKRYNNHTSMNTDQKAFTYIDKFARHIRKILDSRFFLDYSDYSEQDKVKGVVERIVIETIMCTNHLDKWKKQPKAICRYLNDNAVMEEFERLAYNLHRLEKIITDDTKDIFNKKDSFIFLTLFDKFTGLGVEDIYFADFLREFKNNIRLVKRNNDGMLFDEIDKDKSTKDKPVIIAKLNMLESLLLEYLHINKNNSEEVSILDFIKENVNQEVENRDIQDYQEDFEILTLDVDNENKLCDKENRLSLLAIIAYGYKEDIRIDNWFLDYFKRNSTYKRNQKENFMHMKKDLDRFIDDEARKSA